MNYAEFKRQIGKAGLNFKGFAELLKLNPKSISNFSKKESVPDHLGIIAALLGEMAEHQIDFIQLVEKLNIQPQKPRGKGFKKSNNCDENKTTI